MIEKAPKITDYLNTFSASRFQEVLKALSSLGIQYEVNPKLVRGLDYYTHSIFEFVASSSELGK